MNKVSKSSAHLLTVELENNHKNITIEKLTLRFCRFCNFDKHLQEALSKYQVYSKAENLYWGTDGRSGGNWFLSEYG